MWHRCLANSTELKSFTTLEEQDALTRPASLVASAEMVSVEVSAGDLLSSSAVFDDEEERSMRDLAEVDADEQVGVKPRLCDL